MTEDSDYTCPKCSYSGRLVLYALRKKTTVYFISVGPEHGREGVMCCPACNNTFTLSKRKYQRLDKVRGGAELVEALRSIGEEVQRQFPRPGMP